MASAKVESSGISEAQALALGMYSTESATSLDNHFEAKPALVIPYTNTDGQPMRAHPTWPDFYRLRYLDAPGKGKSFGDATGTKGARYTQPPGTGVCAYFPNCTDWKRIREDTSEPILITEGELKAAKASLEGFPTIGLGGVYNFRSSKAGVFFLPELEAFKWARRRVTIVYDSDYASKPNICAAINILAEELQERGALVDLATLPDVYDPDEKKTGLDDFLCLRSDDALVKLLHAAEPLALVSRLWQMNAEVVYVADPGFVVAQDSRYKMKASDFTGHSDWATASTPERRVKPDGSMSLEKVAAAPVWLKWPLRRSVSKLTYAPGQELFCTDGKRECLNLWDGWGITPAKGDITPWKKLIEFIFEGESKENIEWFLDWCAYPLQNPGAKLFSAVVVHGTATGTGKSLIGYTLGKIYGPNFNKIENKHLKSDFNGWAANRQFILGDEVFGGDKRTDADAFKTTITQEEISINVKNVPEYTIPDCINYYFTSNHADAFFLEDKDRRFFIHEVTHDDPLPFAFYQAYDAWKDGDGPAALFAHLLARDVSKFNPKAPPPLTAAKRRMIHHGKSDLAVWVNDLKTNPAAILRLGQMRYTRDMFTSKELLAMYAATHDGAGKVTANGMARALAAAGFKQAYLGLPIPVDETQGRYFIVRNAATWAKVKTLKDLTKHIKQPLVRGVT